MHSRRSEQHRAQGHSCRHHIPQLAAGCSLFESGHRQWANHRLTCAGWRLPFRPRASPLPRAPAWQARRNACAASPAHRRRVPPARAARCCAGSIARISSSSLICIASVSRFWVFWIRNTIRNVMMVVPVLITSCQVSVNPKIGPVTRPDHDDAGREDETQRMSGEMGRRLGEAGEGAGVAHVGFPVAGAGCR